MSLKRSQRKVSAIVHINCLYSHRICKMALLVSSIKKKKKKISPRMSIFHRPYVSVYINDQTIFISGQNFQRHIIHANFCVKPNFQTSTYVQIGQNKIMEVIYTHTIIRQIFLKRYACKILDYV